MASPADDSPTPAFEHSPSELERYRPYLEVLARAGLGAKVRRRVGASDIVQETLVNAYTARDTFRGDGEASFLAWLRRILARRLANAVRDHHRERRDVDLERSIDAAVDRSSVAMASLVAASGPSPSEQAAGTEETLRLASAISELPERQRDVVQLFHLDGRTLAEISDELGLTRHAVTRALRTAMRGLRAALREPESRPGTRYE